MSRYGDNVKARIRRSHDAAVERADWRDKYELRSDDEQEQQWKAIEKSLNDATEKNLEFDSMGHEWLKRHDAAKNQGMQSRILTSMQRRLVFSCLQPLCDDFSVAGALTTLGMFSAYMATNPQMRERVSKGINKYRAAKYERMAIDAREHPEKFGNKFKAARWERKYERYAAKANDGHVPFTPEAAANMKLAYEKRHYDDTRAILNDYKDGKISQDERDEKLEDLDLLHEEHVDTLYRVAQADGLAINEVDRAERIMVDRIQRFDKSSKYNFMFDGLAQKRVSKAPAMNRTYRVPDGKGSFKTEHVKVWDGEYVNEKGQSWDHSFDARPPYNVESLANDIADTMTVSYQDAANFAQTGNPNGLAETKLMLINMMNHYAHPDQPLQMPEEMMKDPENAALMGCYADLYNMAGEDTMNYKDMVKATGLGSAQGFATWMASESLHNSYELGHDTVQDLQQAFEFADLSRHVDPNSERWEKMANKYFAQVFPEDKFNAPDPEAVREVEQQKVDKAQKEVDRLTAAIADRKNHVKPNTGHINQTSDQLNKSDNKTDSEADNKPEIELSKNDKEADTLASKLERLSAVASNHEDSLGDIQAALHDAEEKLMQAKQHRDEQVAKAEQLRADNADRIEAIEANRIRREGTINMSRNFVSCCRQAEAFGNTPDAAWDAVEKGIGKGITAWTDEDANNFRFAKAAREHASKSVMRFSHKFCHGQEWQRPDPTPTATAYMKNIAQVVSSRYNNKKSYGQQAAERFGMNDDNNDSYDYERDE